MLRGIRQTIAASIKCTRCCPGSEKQSKETESGARRGDRVTTGGGVGLGQLELQHRRHLVLHSLIVEDKNRASLGADTAAAITLDELTVSFFSQALENVATLRADNGGTSSR